jgi:PAS domain S-box-containing protein
MSDSRTGPNTNIITVEGGAAFLHALNAAAASLQRSSHSEADVFAAFKEQISRLGLVGVVALLGESDDCLRFAAVIIPEGVRTRLVKWTGFHGEGFTIDPRQVDVFRQVLQTGEAVFLRAVAEPTWQLTPSAARHFVRLFFRFGRPTAGICAPLIIEGRVLGLCMVSGAQLSEQEGPALVAFANHIAIALENARLFQAMRAELIERIETEQALRRSEDRFRIVAENAPGVIYLCRNDYRFSMHYVNDAIERLTGYPKEAFLSDAISFRDLYHPDDSVWLMPEDGVMLSQRGAFQLSYRIRHRSGEWRWVEDYGGGVFDDEGHLLFLAGFLSDISGRKQAEEALQESQRVLSTLMSNLPGMAYRCRNDENWTIEFASEGSWELLGYEPAELQQNRVIAYGDIIVPEDREKVSASVQAALSERRSFRLTYRVRTRRGSEKWVWEHGRGVFLPGGELLCLEGFITDITERKQAEEAVRYAQKMESLGILAGGVAHDFNNLLVAMLGQTSLALAHLPPANAARTHVEKAIKAAQRAADLTLQLLAYSGRGQLKVAPLQFNGLIEENVHLMKATVPKHVELQLSLAQPLPAIEADRGQMQQIIMNLIINAAEAIGERPGRVTLTTRLQRMTEAENHSIFQRYTNQPLASGSYVALIVADDGCGMADDTLARIFDPFFTTKFTGRGLGLAAVLGIVRGHRGGLHITSEVGKGTTFHLLFPATDAPAEKEPPPPSAGISGQQYLVLVIDDEEPVREAVRDILEMEGIKVITAANGAKGVELYRRQAEAINLVVLDLSMPGLGGEETFQALRAANPQVNVILSSGYSEAEVSRRFQEDQIVDFVQKPFDVADFVERIWRHLVVGQG